MRLGGQLAADRIIAAIILSRVAAATATANDPDEMLDKTL